MSHPSISSDPHLGDPGHGFVGRMGKTLAESEPHWRTPLRARAGAPNVVVILFDDMGYSDLGCFGGEIQTPHMDRLARQGLLFSGYTTVPMCTPARAALLTGKNPHSVGCGWLTHSDPGYPGYRGEMSLDAPTMAELLRAAGYTTLCAGKWHNTYDANARPGGDTSSWPLQRGFDQFYGFMGAETHYFQPDRMMEGNQPAGRAQYPADYFAPDDYTGRAIDWLSTQRANSPEKPFFLYLAFQSPHTPHHAKPSDLERYRGRYDAGWDALRRERFDRQVAMGLHAPHTQFAPRNPGVPAWDSLSESQRALHARQMEAYAALVDNADQNVGRMLAHLEATGQLDNTLIFITSDNGANSVGGPEGTLNLQGRRQGQPEPPELVARLLHENRIGAGDTYPSYSSGWTQVSNTPFRFYKRTPMAGGIRVPLIAHWPSGSAQAGQARSQWVHVTDILPTVLEVVGQDYPSQFKGLRTRGMDGQSFAHLLQAAGGAQRRDRQYYELQGNRGYIEGAWKIVSLQVPREPLKLDNWMLFNIEADPAEVHDRSRDEPERLQQLVAAFEAQASAHYVYPIDNRDDMRTVAQPPYQLADRDVARDFTRGVEWVPNTVISPLIGERNYRLQAWFDWAEGDEGVILAIGDSFAGISLFVMDGALHFTYQWWFNPTELVPIPLRPGAQHFELDFSALGARKGQGDFRLNGAFVVQGVGLSPTIIRVPSGGLSVGLNRRIPISQRYAQRGVFAYSGAIQKVRIEPGAHPPGVDQMLDESAIQARMRQSTGA